LIKNIQQLEIECSIISVDISSSTDLIISTPISPDFIKSTTNLLNSVDVLEALRYELS